MAGSPQTDKCKDIVETARCEGIMDGTMGQVSETISSDRCTWTVNTVVLGGVSEALAGTGGGTGGNGSRVDRPGQAGWVSPGHG